MLRNILVFLLFFAFTAQIAAAQNIIQFKVSKPYCIFNFLEAANNSSRSPRLLKKIIGAGTKGDENFKAIRDSFNNLQLDYSYKREEYPASRRQYRSTYDLIDIALVSAGTIAEFKNRAIGILPNASLQQLVELLQAAEPYYDRLIWNDNQQKLNNQAKALEAYAGTSSGLFNAISHFYNSTWTADIPFIVALYPIPGARGGTSATPHANSLCVGVLTESTDHIGTMSVVLHEMCHVLYDEQTSAFQHRIAHWFDGNSSAYKQYAYNFFDEGLATALGNGWAYTNLNGKPDTTAWYNNVYIDGFGRALYPLVSDYINGKQQMDSLFVNKAIGLFAKTFPRAINDYAIALNNVNIYTDVGHGGDTNDLLNSIGEYFHLTSTWLMTPILDDGVLKAIAAKQQTQLIVITKNHAVELAALKKIFPQLGPYLHQKPGSVFNLSFIDDKKRPVIILNGDNKADISGLLKQMKTQQYFDLKKVMQ